MPPLGIPYAFADIENGDRICPVCGARIPERYGVTGEQISDNYPDHYVKEHSDAL